MSTPKRRQFSCTNNLGMLPWNGTNDDEASRSNLAGVELPYVPLRKEGASNLKLQKKPKYTIVMSDIPLGVEIQGNLLGKISRMKYDDHDLADTKKFPQFRIPYYM